MPNPIQVEGKVYSIPQKFRVTENLHIIFWLLKDLSWAMLWKPIGVIMFVPTLILSIIITRQTRSIASELYHNIAVTSWICANGYWMVTEFFWSEDDSLRYFASIPFGIGLCSILFYYLVIAPREKKMVGGDK
jgi:hypothetical protein